MFHGMPSSFEVTYCGPHRASASERTGPKIGDTDASVSRTVTLSMPKTYPRFGARARPFLRKIKGPRLQTPGTDDTVHIALMRTFVSVLAAWMASGRAFRGKMLEMSGARLMRLAASISIAFGKGPQREP